MTNWFDRYAAPDVVVTDAAGVLRCLEAKLGLPVGQSVRPTLYGSGFDVGNLAVNGDEMLAASGIQLMGLQPLGVGEPENETGRILRATLLAYITAQRRDRPIVSHVNCLSAPTTDHIQQMTDLLRSRAVPHIAKIDNVYIGLIDDGKRIRYDPSVDGGLMLEFAPTFSSRYPGFVAPPRLAQNPVEVAVAPGTMVRPTARTHLVQSIDVVLDRLRAIVDWPEEDSLERRDGDGYRSCTLLPQNGLSAVWELIEPTRPDSRAGRAFEKFGAGPWTIRIGVFGLDEKLEDLARRGTRWKRIEDGPLGRRVAVRRCDLAGIPIELENMPVVYRGVRASALDR